MFCHIEVKWKITFFAKGTINFTLLISLIALLIFICLWMIGCMGLVAENISSFMGQWISVTTYEFVSHVIS